MLLALSLPAFAITDKQQKDITNLNKQIFELKKQLIDKYVESGQIPAEKGKKIKDHMNKKFEIRSKKGFTAPDGKGFKGHRGTGKCPAAQGSAKNTNFSL